MKRLLALLALLALASPAPAEEKAVRLEAVLPKDCVAAFLVEDVPGLIAGWDRSPMARTLADARVQEFFAPFRDTFWKKVKEGSGGAGEPVGSWEDFSALVLKHAGQTPEELAKLFQGQVAFALTNAGSLKPKAPEEEEIPAPEGIDEAPPILKKPAGRPGLLAPMPEGALIADIGGNREAVEKLGARSLEHMQKRAAEEGAEYREVTEEFQGETLRISQVLKDGKTHERDGWAIVGRMLVAAHPKALLQQVVAGLKKGGAEASLASHPGFQRVRAQAPRAVLTAYVNLEPLAALAKEEMGKMPENDMGITPDGLWKALGLDALRTAFLAASLGEASAELDAGLLFSERKGILKLLAIPPGPAPRPAFIPMDAVTFGGGRFSLKGFLEAVEAIATDISPAVGAQIQMLEQMVTAQTGVDLKKDLLGGLGEEFASASSFRASGEPGKAPSTAEMDQLIAVAVADRQALEAAIEGLKAMGGDGAEGGPFEKRDYLGNTIHTLKTPISALPGQPEQHLQYALTDRWLLVCVGSAAPLESALGTLAKPGALVWDHPDVKRALDALPPGACSLSYTDMPRAVIGIFDSLASFQSVSGFMQMLGMGGMGGENPICDPNAKPDAEALKKLWGPVSSGSYLAPDGFILRQHLAYPKPEAP